MYDKTEYNEETILQDIRALIRDLEPKYIEFDIRPFVEPNLIRLGYPYTFNDNRSFEVTVAPGCILKGNRNRSSGIDLSPYIHHGQLSYEHDYGIRVPLGDWEPFMPQVESLICGVQKLKQKYDELARGEMQAMILGSLVEPYIKEIGLDTATLEVSVQGDFVLKLPIFNNAHLRVVLTFDNYKKYCDSFASIKQSLHEITKLGIQRGIELELLKCLSLSDITTSRNNGSWQVNDEKMTYLDKFPEYGDFSQDIKRIGPSVYQCLSDLGYVFYIEDGKLHIMLNKNISLIRSLATKQTYFQYKNKSGQKMIVKDKPFVHLLQMTATASFKTGYNFKVNSVYKYYINDEIPFYDNLYLYFERLLPYKTVWNNVKTFKRIYTSFKDGIVTSYTRNGGIFHILFATDYYIKIRPMAGNTIDVVWAILENLDDILKIPDILRDYPDFSLYIDDRNEDFELPPNNG